MSVYFFAAAFFLQILFAQAQNIISGSSTGDQPSITAGEYCSFLNQVASSDSYHLYDEKMAVDTSSACILRKGQPGNYTYSVLLGRKKAAVSFLSKHNFVIYKNFYDDFVPNNTLPAACSDADDIEENDPELKSNTIYFLKDNFASSPQNTKTHSKQEFKSSVLILDLAGIICIAAVGTKACLGDSSLTAADRRTILNSWAAKTKIEILKQEVEEDVANGHLWKLIDFKTKSNSFTGEETVNCKPLLRTIDEAIASRRKSLLEYQIKRSISLTLNKIIDDLGYSLFRNKLGQGASGSVYQIKDQGLNRDLVLKGITTAVPFHSWRQGELVVTAEPETFPNVMKIEALIFHAKRTDNKTEILLYLPKEKAKTFQNKLKTNASIYNSLVIVAQIIEQARGKNLHNLFKSSAWKDTILSVRIKYFDNFIPQIFAYFQVAIKKNFSHGDISPSNLVYDTTKNKLTIVDLGFSTQLDSYWEFSPERYEQGHDYKASMTLTGTQGTKGFIAPAVQNDQSYGAEADAFSFGKVLLRMIDPITYDAIYEEKPTQMDSIENYSAQMNLRTEQNKESPAPILSEFLNSNDYQGRRDLIDAFFNLGCSSKCYSDSDNPADWRNTMHQSWRQLEDAREKCYGISL